METTWHIGLLVFVGISCAVYLLTLSLNRYGAAIDLRLEQIPKASSSSTPSHSKSEEEAKTLTLNSWLRRLVPNQESEKTLHQLRLFQAGIYSPSALATFFVVKLALMIIPPIVAMICAQLGYFDSQRAILAGCASGMAGMLLPGMWLDRQIKRRRQPTLPTSTARAVQSATVTTNNPGSTRRAGIVRCAMRRGMRKCILPACICRWWRINVDAKNWNF